MKGGRAGLLGLALALAAMSGRASAQAEGWPYFDASVPPNEAVFEISPGVPFTALQNIMAYDPDVNNTEAGRISISQDDARGLFRPVNITRGVYVGANPGFMPICPSPMPANEAADLVQKCKYLCPETPAPSASAATRCAQWPANMAPAGLTSFNFTYFRDATGRQWTNRTVFSFTMPSLGDPPTFSSPFRRVCITLASRDKLTTFTTGFVAPPPEVT